MAGEQYSTINKDTSLLVEQTIKMIGQLQKGEEVDVNDTEQYDNGVKVVPAVPAAPGDRHEGECGRGLRQQPDAPRHREGRAVSSRHPHHDGPRSSSGGRRRSRYVSASHDPPSRSRRSSRSIAAARRCPHRDRAPARGERRERSSRRPGAGRPADHQDWAADQALPLATGPTPRARHARDAAWTCPIPRSHVTYYLFAPQGRARRPEGLAPSSGEPPQPKPLNRENKAFWSRMGSHSSKLSKSAAGDAKSVTDSRLDKQSERG